MSGEKLTTPQKLKVSQFKNLETYPFDNWYTVRDFIAN